jgi:hypothetical protein
MVSSELMSDRTRAIAHRMVKNRTVSRLWPLAALGVVIMSFGACGDDTTNDDGPGPTSGGGQSDAVGDSLADPDVALSNVPNEAEAPLDPPGS